MPTILIKKSDTPGSVPGTANLTNLAGGAEVAVNTADRRMFTMNSSSAVVEVGTNPSSLTCADGSFTLLKAASASITNLTATSLVLSNLSIASANVTTLTSASATITNLLATTLTISGGTANGVLYLNASKLATSGSALTFDGTNLGVGGTGYSRFSTSTGLIGNNGYANALRVYDDGSASTSQSSNSYGLGFVDNAALSYTAGTSGTHRFYVANSEGMRLTSTGLGIGTSSPATKLHVSGGTNATFTLQGDTGGGATFINLSADTNATKAQISGAKEGASGGRLIFSYANSSGSVTEGVRLDSSGNLGLGVTPSAWNLANYKALEVGGLGCGFFNATNDTVVTSNAYYNASWKYATTNPAAIYSLNGGAHKWSVAASGTAGNAITFTQAMTLDAGGRLLIGRTVSDANNYRIQISQGSATYGSGIQFVYEGVGAAAIWENSSGALVFGNDGADGDTERARITSGGNFGIGTSSPNARLEVYPGTITGSASQEILRLDVPGNNISSTATGYINFRGYDLSNGTQRDVAYIGVELDANGSSTPYMGGIIKFNTCASGASTSVIERARITSGGNFLIGRTAQQAGEKFNVTGDIADTYLFRFFHDGNNSNRYGGIIQCGSDDASGTNYSLAFDDGDGTRQGQITFSGGTTTYGTSSDYRLKENIRPIDNATARLAQLKPCKWEWKRNGRESEGFVAHELQEVVPIAVAGEKDEVDANGNPMYQSVGAANVVPLLTAALQEAMARIEKLEAEVAALKGA